MVIEQIIQNGDIPTLSPKMRGPQIKPSNCCNAKMKRAVQIAGIIPFVNNTIKTTGTPPMNGPK